MKFVTFCITFISFALITLHPVSAEKSPQERQHDSIYSDLRKLEQKRATIQALPADDPVRTRHIANLQELYKRAKTIEDYSMPIAIHTELRRFGITIPKEVSLTINDDEIVPPKTLIHPTTHVIYYLESDGRHVTAIVPDGTIIWHRNPFNDASLEPYRFSKPVIVYFNFSSRDPNPNRIGISFNSSQFGEMDLTTGDFRFGGQD